MLLGEIPNRDHPSATVGPDPQADDRPRRVRVSGKALIIRDDRLLVTVNSTPGDPDWMLLPGGGQEFGETIHEAVKREVLEEASLDVAVGGLACIRDYIGDHHEFAADDYWFHQLELMFWCHVVDDAEPHPGAVVDTYQVGLRWVPLADIATTNLYPHALRGWLAAAPEDRPIYLGDVN